MPARPMSLAQLAAPTGFLIADIAFLSGLEESTLSRLWDDPDWLDRVKGKTLQAIVSVVPGIGEYLAGFSLADRRSRLAEDLSRTDVDLDEAEFRRLVQQRRVPEQYLGNALDAAVHILRRDVRQAASCLARFWGRDQDFALGYLFGNEKSSCLLSNPGPLISASMEIIEALNEHKRSFHAIVAQANLMHHVARARPGFIENGSALGLDRQSALAFRSTVMGRIMTANDFDLAERYGREVADSPLLSLVEGWAFPTYTHDARATADFSLPRSVSLRRTADEIVREIGEYNEAYLCYLSQTSIPTLIRQDPTFGSRLPELVKTVRARHAMCEEPAARYACESLLQTLTEDAENNGKRAAFHDIW